MNGLNILVNYTSLLNLGNKILLRKVFLTMEMP